MHQFANISIYYVVWSKQKLIKINHMKPVELPKTHQVVSFYKKI